MSSVRESKEREIKLMEPNPYLLPNAFVRYIVPELVSDYKKLYGSYPYISEYHLPPKTGIKEAIEITKNRINFKVQFNQLVYKFKLWGAEKKVELTSIKRLETFRSNFFHPMVTDTQSALYFGTVKKLLEDILFLLRNEKKPLETRIRSYMDLCEGLTMCAPGIASHCDNIKEQLLELVSLTGCLASFRTTIIQQIASQYIEENKARVSAGNELHVHAAHLNYAHRIGLEPISDLKEGIVKDHFIRTVGLDESDPARAHIVKDYFKKFEVSFYRRYTEGIIPSVETFFCKAYSDILQKRENKEGWVEFPSDTPDECLALINSLPTRIGFGNDLPALFYEARLEPGFMIRYSKDTFITAFLKFCFDKEMYFKKELWQSMEDKEIVFRCFNRQYQHSWIEKDAVFTPIKDIDYDSLNLLLSKDHIYSNVSLSEYLFKLKQNLLSIHFNNISIIDMFNYLYTMEHSEKINWVSIANKLADISKKNLIIKSMYAPDNKKNLSNCLIDEIAYGRVNISEILPKFSTLLPDIKIEVLNSLCRFYDIPHVIQDMLPEFKKLDDINREKMFLTAASYGNDDLMRAFFSAEFKLDDKQKGILFLRVLEKESLPNYCLNIFLDPEMKLEPETIQDVFRKCILKDQRSPSLLGLFARGKKEIPSIKGVSPIHYAVKKGSFQTAYILSQNHPFLLKDINEWLDLLIKQGIPRRNKKLTPELYMETAIPREQLLLFIKTLYTYLSTSSFLSANIAEIVREVFREMMGAYYCIYSGSNNKNNYHVNLFRGRIEKLRNRLRKSGESIFSYLNSDPLYTILGAVLTAMQTPSFDVSGSVKLENLSLDREQLIRLSTSEPQIARYIFNSEFLREKIFEEDKYIVRNDLLQIALSHPDSAIYILSGMGSLYNYLLISYETDTIDFIKDFDPAKCDDNEFEWTQKRVISWILKKIAASHPLSANYILNREVLLEQLLTGNSLDIQNTLMDLIRSHPNTAVEIFKKSYFRRMICIQGMTEDAMLNDMYRIHGDSLEVTHLFKQYKYIRARKINKSIYPILFKSSLFSQKTNPLRLIHEYDEAVLRENIEKRSL